MFITLKEENKNNRNSRSKSYRACSNRNEGEWRFDPITDDSHDVKTEGEHIFDKRRKS